MRQQYRLLIDGHWLEAASIDARDATLPTFVLLHEGLGSVSHWKDFPSVLADATGAGVFLYSRYGHGASDALDGPRSFSYMHHEAQVVLPEILSKAGITRPLLLGQSDGASIAILYAGLFPDSPTGLILEAPHCFVEDITMVSIAQVRARYLETDLPRRLGKYHANVESLFWGWNDIWLDAGFRDWNIEAFLDSIRCPVLVLQGLQDEYGSGRQIEAIRSKLPSARTILLDNCGHAPHHDRLDATIAAIARFIQSDIQRHESTSKARSL